METVIQSIITVVLAGSVAVLVIIRIRSQNQMQQAAEELIDSYRSFGEVLDRLQSTIDMDEHRVPSLLGEPRHSGSSRTRLGLRYHPTRAHRRFQDANRVFDRTFASYISNQRNFHPTRMYIRGPGSFSYWDYPDRHDDEWEVMEYPPPYADGSRSPKHRLSDRGSRVFAN